MAEPTAVLVPYAHVGHYLWILYLLPVLIVVASLIKTTISEKRAARAQAATEQGAEKDGPDTPAEGTKP